jgi:sugar diacid utilization regulator
MATRSRPPAGTDRREWLSDVVQATAGTVGASSDLLGEFPQHLLTAAVTGRRPDRAALDAIADLGRGAAEHGVSADAAVNLYLSLAARLWRQLPAEVRQRRAVDVHLSAEAVLTVTAEAVARLISGHQIARQQMIRHEQTARQEFLDDLLRGDADVARMVQRAEPFGLDLATAHHVALAAPADGRPDVDRAALSAERAVVDAFGDREVLVGTKEGRIVVIVPGNAGPSSARSSATLDVARTLQARIERASHDRGSWRVAAGRAFPGSFGVARSYEEAREMLHLAQTLGVDPVDLSPGQLLVHRVIGRDQAATIDLVRAVLMPLQQARGGAEPLLATLNAYFECGRTSTEAARRLHVSVRTVTYRLDRVRRLTGYDPTVAGDGFVLQTAVNGARLLGWPARPLPPP